MTNNKTFALGLALAICTMMSGVIAMQITAVFAQGNVTQAGNQTGNQQEASHRQQIRQLLPQLLGNNQVHEDIRLTGN